MAGTAISSTTAAKTAAKAAIKSFLVIWSTFLLYQFCHIAELLASHTAKFFQKRRSKPSLRMGLFFY